MGRRQEVTRHWPVPSSRRRRRRAWATEGSGWDTLFQSKCLDGGLTHLRQDISPVKTCFFCISLAARRLLDDTRRRAPYLNLDDERPTSAASGRGPNRLMWLHACVCACVCACVRRDVTRSIELLSALSDAKRRKVQIVNSPVPRGLGSGERSRPRPANARMCERA